MEAVTSTLPTPDRLLSGTLKIIERFEQGSYLTAVLHAWTDVVEAGRRSRGDAFFDAFEGQLQAAKRRCAHLEAKLAVVSHRVAVQPSVAALETLLCIVACWRLEARACILERRHQGAARSVAEKRAADAAGVFARRVMLAWREGTQPSSARTAATAVPMEAIASARGRSSLSPTALNEPRHMSPGRELSTIRQVSPHRGANSPALANKCTSSGRKLPWERQPALPRTRPGSNYSLLSTSLMSAAQSEVQIGAAEVPVSSPLARSSSSGSVNVHVVPLEAKPSVDFAVMSQVMANPAVTSCSPSSPPPARSAPPSAQPIASSVFRTCSPSSPRAAQPMTPSTMRSPCSQSSPPRWSDMFSSDNGDDSPSTVHGVDRRQSVVTSGSATVVAGALRCTSPLPRGPERFFYDTARYTGCARFGGNTVFDGLLGPPAAAAAVVATTGTASSRPSAVRDGLCVGDVRRRRTCGPWVGSGISCTNSPTAATAAA